MLKCKTITLNDLTVYQEEKKMAKQSTKSVFSAKTNEALVMSKTHEFNSSRVVKKGRRFYGIPHKN